MVLTKTTKPQKKRMLEGMETNKIFKKTMTANQSPGGSWNIKYQNQIFIYPLIFRTISTKISCFHVPIRAAKILA